MIPTTTISGRPLDEHEKAVLAHMGTLAHHVVVLDVAPVTLRVRRFRARAKAQKDGGPGPLRGPDPAVFAASVTASLKPPAC